MSIVSSWDGFRGPITMAAIWLQPVVWMMVFYIKSTRLDHALKMLTIVALGILAVSYLLPIDWPIKYLFNHLFILYGSLALIFALTLMKLGWHAPQALSAGFLTAFVGSYLWETPYIIRNAFITGPQGDWFLHAVGLFYVYFMAGTVGWQVNRRSALLITCSLLVSTAFMLNWQIPPLSSTSVVIPDLWNNDYWMLNRAIGTCITFMVIRKSPPVVKGFGK